MPSTPSSPDARPSRSRYVALAIVCALIAGVAIAVILVTEGNGGSSSAASCALPPTTSGATAKAEVNGPAPDFTLCSIDGKPVSGATIRFQDVGIGPGNVDSNGVVRAGAPGTINIAVVALFHLKLGMIVTLAGCAVLGIAYGLLA